MKENILTFFNILRIRLKHNNFGVSFHQNILPNKRIFFSINDKEVQNYRKSAVMMVLFEDDYRLKSLLIRRSKYFGTHSDQISFPGGKVEPFDINLEQTAIRETKEEINVDINSNDIVGELTPLVIPISQFLVYPYICFLKKAPDYSIDNHEVAEIIEFDIETFIKKTVIQNLNVNIKDQIMEVPAFKIDNHIVWGATAMILNEFREISKEIFESERWT
ncbi:MAG: CoA pyrophosphatase [Bacteroidota bacterium]